METRLARENQARERLRRNASFDAGLGGFRLRTEKGREKEVYKYLHAWVSLYRPPVLHRAAFAHTDQPLPAPEPCNDTALTALAQLCALRMNARRVLISLATGDFEYVLTEATRTMSLQYDAVVEDAADTPWIGCCSFPRTDGINHLAIDAWRKARQYRDPPANLRHYYQEGRSAHSCIISDAEANAEYSDRPFVTRAPSIRFFCSIPLRDSNGVVLGALSIADDKPRYGVSAAEMLMLEDIADTITGSLETCLVRSQQQRSERMIQALGLFNGQKSSLRDWWLGKDNDRLRKTGRYHSDPTVDLESQSNRLDQEFGVQVASSGFSVASERRSRREKSTDSELRDPMESIPSETAESNANADNLRATQGVSGRDFDQRPTKPLSEQPDFVGEEARKSDAAWERPSPKSKDHARGVRDTKQRAEFDLATAIEEAYARAANLIHEAMHVSGVVFVDAKRAAATLKRGSVAGSAPQSQSEAFTSSSYSEGHPYSQSEGEPSEQAKASRSSRICGFATRDRSSLAGSPSSAHHFALNEAELQALVKRYPRGKIFNFAESGDVYSSSEEGGTSTEEGRSEISDAGSQRESSSRLRKSRTSKDATRLGKVMNGAQTIAFFPIWDDGAESYSSALFVWSTTPRRFFSSEEDMPYLLAFGFSLTAELARLHSLASDKAKGTFISSISHELRSPLHGVLAGAEMMYESDLTQFQEEMLLTITMAGRTLLDTINHILDYSKISSRSRSRKPRKRLGTRLDMDGSEELIDIGRLTEDVIESVVSAQRFERMSKSSIATHEYRNPNSHVPIYPSSEFTEANDVAVLLNIDKRESWWANLSPGSWTRIITNLVGNALKYTRSGTVTITLSAEDDAPDSTTVRLRVDDTGIGMSEQFVASGMFTPYKQADNNSTGTGLGLSIVKEITKELRAKLEVDSEPGRGTRLSLQLRTAFKIPGTEHLDLADQQLMGDVANMGLRHFHFISSDVGDHQGHITGDRNVYGSVLAVAAQWLGCSLTTGMPTGDVARASVCAIDEQHLTQLAKTQPRALEDMLSTVAAQGARLLVLASHFHSLSLNMTFSGFSVKPRFVRQPVGPRKLLRAIAAGESETATPTSQSREQSLYHTSPPPTTPLSVRPSAQPRLEGTSFPWNVHTGRTGSSSNSITPFEPAQAESLSAPNDVLGRVSRTRGSSAPDSLKKRLASPSAEQMAQNVLTESADGLDVKSVLLVEDNPVNMQLLKALMKKLNLPFDSAVNGKEALDLFAAKPDKYFLILTDISMPVMDGNEATAAIRALERRRKLAKTTIAAVTGVTSAASQKASFDAGVDKYYTKPVRMSDLKELVDEVRGGS